MPVEGELEDVLRAAREAGAALIAAHPYSLEQCKNSPRPTGGFAANWSSLKPLVDRIELFNRDELFAWTSGAGVPAVATGDFHRREHLASWKTLIPCGKTAHDVVDYLAGPASVLLARFEAGRAQSLAA